MKTSLKYTITLSIIAVLLLVGYAALPENETNANQSSLFVSPSTFVGTTTTPFYSHLRAGAGTTTVYLPANIGGIDGAVDSASLLIQLTATSTPATLKWRYEFSEGFIGANCVDTPNVCDWYPESIELGGAASTTVVVRDFKEYSWLYASSTAGSSNNNNRALKLVSVPTPTRYVRAVFYLPPGSPNAAIFSRFVSKVQK